MNSRLLHIQNWPELAQQANWCVAALARLCGVSVKTLERHFHKNMGTTVKALLVEQRQHRAIELLRDGSSVKETASQLGYSYAHHFSREFKKHYGCCPTTQMASTKPKPGDCRILV